MLDPDQKLQNIRNLMGEKLIKIGDKYIHMPNLLKGVLALRTPNKGYPKNRVHIIISPELKNMFLDIIFENKFDKVAYEKLSPEEQKVFDDTLVFCKFSTHNIAKAISYSEREKTELLRQFDVLKGEVLAGNNSPDLLKKMRNLLLDLNKKKYISKDIYNKLLAEVLACI